MTLEEYLQALRAHFGLNEAVNLADSHESLKNDLEQALQGWSAAPAEDLEVLYVFSDRLVAYRWRYEQGRDQSQAWEIPWSRDAENGFVFGTPIKVERVTRYEPVSGMGAMGESKGERFTESVEQALSLGESTAGGGRRIKAIGITSDVVNENRRRYPRAVLAQALAELNTHLHESAGQGRLILTGEAEHPSSKSGRANILETVVKWEQAALSASGQVILEGVILPTAKGKDVQVLVENGVRVGVSQRAYGTASQVEESGETINEVVDLTITGYDLVAEPSDPNGRIVESRQREEQAQTPVQEKKPMNLEELLALLKEKPEMAEALMKRLGLANRQELAEAMGADPAKLEEAMKAGKAAQDELDERRRKEAVEKAIVEATKDLAYGDDMNTLFVEAVRSAEPETAEAVASLVEAKRKEYDAIAARSKLNGMGMQAPKPKGPTIERFGSNFEEAGWPEYARASYELSESIRRGTLTPRRDWANPKTINEEFAARYLKRFDEQYMHHLKREAAEFAEATQTSDLNLPYSVSRAIIAEAFPMLVATSIFDVDTTDQAPTRIYFETTTGETGYTVTTSPAEDVTAVLNGWADLDNARLTPGSVTITNSAANVTYVEGTDYVIDYVEGRIKAIATITDAQALKATYTYTAIRKGEMAAIERAKTTLTFKTLDVAADRLATEISSEAIVFSRSQLGWDVTSRTLTNLVRQVRRKIDQGIIYTGIGAALQVASNSGGTWVAASDPVAQLIEKIGVARVKVASRYYEPTFLLVSTANSDKIANWDGFTAAGKRPDSDLQANGYVGRLKGLATFDSTEMPDGYALVGNRELVMHRIFQAMRLMGPFPSYSSGKLVAADQYYAEEYNGTDAPVLEKGSYVKIT